MKIIALHFHLCSDVRFVRALLCSHENISDFHPKASWKLFSSRLFELFSAVHDLKAAA